MYFQGWLQIDAQRTMRVWCIGYLSGPQSHHAYF